MVDPRNEAVRIARAILDERMGISEGCIALDRLAAAIVETPFYDEDFVTFLAVSSETDGLPVGPERTYWDPGHLEIKDRVRVAYECEVRDSVLAACRRVLERFSDAKEGK